MWGTDSQPPYPPSESEARGKRVAFAACTLPRVSLQVVYVLLFRMGDVGRVFVPT